jgi:cbb3-type cytochrome oxidase subunit 3
MINYISEHAGMVGLLLFVGIFMCITFLAFLPKSKERIESYKYIPLAEDEDELKR